MINFLWAVAACRINQRNKCAAGDCHLRVEAGQPHNGNRGPTRSTRRRRRRRHPLASLAPPALLLPADLWLMDKSPGQLAMGMTYKVAAVCGSASRVACSEGKRTRRCGQLQEMWPEQLAKMVRNYPAQEFSEVSTPQSVYLLQRDLLLLLLHIW